MHLLYKYVNYLKQDSNKKFYCAVRTIVKSRVSLTALKAKLFSPEDTSIKYGCPKQ